MAALAITACGDEGEASDDPESALISDGESGVSNSANRAPWISGTPPPQAMAGRQYSYLPSAGDPEGGAVSFRAINLPGWAVFSTATGRLSGTPQAEHAGRYGNIDIEVSDGDKTARVGAFTIDVVTSAPGTIAISWNPATERVDGSPLTNLRGHRIHWGTESGNYTESVFIDGGGVTAYVIEGLLPASYHIAATTVDADGMESVFSTPVTVTLQ